MWCSIDKKVELSVNYQNELLLIFQVFKNFAIQDYIKNEFSQFKFIFRSFFPSTSPDIGMPMPVV